MSHLADHARAFRALQGGLSEAAVRSHDMHDEPTRNLLVGLSSAYGMAADDLEEQDRASVLDHSCTMDHTSMPTPKCAACGASRETRS